MERKLESNLSVRKARMDVEMGRHFRPRLIWEYFEMFPVFFLAKEWHRFESVFE